MNYVINVYDIERALQELGGESKAKEIQDHILSIHCQNEIPQNYQDDRSFRQTIQRKIEDYCPQATGFEAAKREGKFLRVGRGLYRLAKGHNSTEFASIEEVPEPGALVEGTTKTIVVNFFERNTAARAACIAHYGWECVICGFDFEETYGELGKAFIHVHHIVPLAEIKAAYVVDPIKDLRPVCANCHAIIHRIRDALSLEEVKDALQDR